MISGYISLSVQLVTGVVDTWGLTLPLSPKDRIYKELLGLELVVQIIEFSYYVWLVQNLHHPEITLFRYYDWAFTTPLMLITLMAFLAPEDSLKTFIKKNANIVSIVIILNALMLISGWKAEMDIENRKEWIGLGFLFWALTFGFILASFFPFSKHPLFAYYTLIWGLYGIAAILPFTMKNNIYNILDLFSKNALGLYLTYIIYQKSKDYQRQKLKNTKK